MDFPRSSGILLHITSLPGKYGIGDFGPAAYRFADWLEEAGQRVWQVLPLGPVAAGYSPYSSPSTFAGNPLLISPERLVDDGLLDPSDLKNAPRFSRRTVDFDEVIPFRRKLLERAYDNFEDGRAEFLQEPFDQFKRRRAIWLEEYALFMALKEAHDGAQWTDWPQELAIRGRVPLAEARKKHARSTAQHMFWQFIFDRQWTALKNYCNERRIRIFGDLPIYVAHDSADVWANRTLFHLDTKGHPTRVAGVPPDYFSETGQRWGNPLYRWNRMREGNYEWWYRRIQSALARFDLVRLDHFRGFESYWEITAEEETAVNGHWVKGPGSHFFKTMKRRLGGLPFIAEDLGDITPEVDALRMEFDLPGMAVLQFGFQGDPSSPYLPHNFETNIIAYTGTHDNDTFVGWWNSQANGSAEDDARPFARRYAGLSSQRDKDLHWRVLQLLMRSVAHTAVVPLQDVLGLGSRARMNVPGAPDDNWRWRFREDQCSEDLAARLREMTTTYGRTPAKSTDSEEVNGPA